MEFTLNFTSLVESDSNTKIAYEDPAKFIYAYRGKVKEIKIIRAPARTRVEWPVERVSNIVAEHTRRI